MESDHLSHFAYSWSHFDCLAGFDNNACPEVFAKAQWC